MTRNRRRHTPEQIIRKLAEGNRLQATGQELDEVCRTLEITSSTWHRWIAQYESASLRHESQRCERSGEW